MPPKPPDCSDPCLPLGVEPLLHELRALVAAGESESPRAEAIRDELDVVWMTLDADQCRLMAEILANGGR